MPTRRDAHLIRGTGHGPDGQDRGPPGGEQEHRDSLSRPGRPPGGPRHPALEVRRDGFRRGHDQLAHRVQEEKGGSDREGTPRDARLRRHRDDRLGRLPGPPVRKDGHHTDGDRRVPVSDRVRPRRHTRPAHGILAVQGVREGDDARQSGGRRRPSRSSGKAGRPG